MAAIETAAQGCFDALRERVRSHLAEALNLTKTDTNKTESTVEMILASLEMDGFDDLVDELRAQLEIIYRDGAKQASKQLGIRLSTEAFELANENAIAFAKQRAAEMVGMRWVKNKLVPNPDAKWRIDEGTREMLRVDVTSAMQDGWSNQKLTNALEENYAFSAKRATVIARTETARADVEGNLTGYRGIGVAKKQWLTAPDCCDLCHEIDGVVVDIDDEFPGVVSGPPLHPNCRCDVLPVLDEAGKVSKAFDPNQPSDEKGQWAGGGGIASLARKIGPGVAFEKTAAGNVDVEAVKKTSGLDVTDYKTVIDTHAMQHAIKQHGSMAEKARGQIPITRDDFNKVPAVLGSNDVSYGGRNRIGREVLVFSRSFPGERVWVSTEVRTGRRELAFQSMWKRRE